MRVVLYLPRKESAVRRNGLVLDVCRPAIRDLALLALFNARRARHAPVAQRIVEDIPPRVAAAAFQRHECAPPSVFRPHLKMRDRRCLRRNIQTSCGILLRSGLQRIDLYLKALEPLERDYVSETRRRQELANAISIIDYVDAHVGGRHGDAACIGYGD